MSPAEYISSGILETYALGAATPAEKQEVEAMLSKSPEIREALDQIQQEIETYASLHAVEPDEALREKILGSITATKSADKTNAAPKVIPLKAEAAPSRLKFIAMAASVILVISIAINITQWKNMNALTAEKQKLDSDYSFEKTQKLFYAEEMVATKRKLDSLANDMNFLRSPMTKNIALNSMIKDHPMKAVVHWDMNTMQVAVDPMTLPVTSPDQKYVLWAIIDGKPVNEGDFAVQTSGGLMKMKVIPEADAFAISLEKSGAVTAPQGPVYVMGQAGSSQP
jgi:anti-sigma-K factor RskA